MGIVRVDVDVSSEAGAHETVSFMIDSGAIYSVLPRRVWRALGLKPKRALEFALVDGTTIRRRVSECRFSYEGVDAFSPVILGEKRDEALLGSVTLENLGLVLNPFERTLRPMRLRLGAMSDAGSAC
jgi:predicted aspartyl protease